jgi:hypothetical protein
MLRVLLCHLTTDATMPNEHKEEYRHMALAASTRLHCQASECMQLPRNSQVVNQVHLTSLYQLLGDMLRTGLSMQLAICRVCKDGDAWYRPKRHHHGCRHPVQFIGFVSCEDFTSNLCNNRVGDLIVWI